MVNRIQAEPIADRFEHLLKIVSSDRFLNQEGIGNEVPFFIAPFRVKETTEMEQAIKQLVNKLRQSGIEVLHVNLYDLIVEMLNNETNDWQWCIENETKHSKPQLLEYLRGVVGSEKVVDAISQKMASADFKVMFLDGVGRVFPFIRSHNILNTLQKSAKAQPTLMFFPGEYSHSLEKGASLDLFGRLHDDKYYRAFNIYDREI